MSAPLANLGRSPRQQFELSIGCVSLRLEMTDAQLFGAASARYAAFAGAAAAQPVTIALNEGAAPEGPPADFDYEFEGAALRVFSSGIRFDGVRHQYALDSLLRVLLSWQLLGHHGFLLHAATVIRNGKAYLFTGRSGAGKSTVASLSPQGSVLTDEISLLRRENGVWRAYGTPFWGEFRAAGSNTSAPVAGIFRLLQAAENRLGALRPLAILRALLPNVLFFSAEAEANRRLLEILGQAATEISGYNLAFRKNSVFWEVLPA
ncbi:MAG TPA: hypothetical protein VEM60_09540 [Candidatus Dormibacteraeota bacterium]|nr:hypothetical protein [Candidatus Dormibacteraeota bacterium]